MKVNLLPGIVRFLILVPLIILFYTIWVVLSTLADIGVDYD